MTETPEWAAEEQEETDAAVIESQFPEGWEAIGASTERPPVATQSLVEAAQILEKPNAHPDELQRAQALAMMSIAATVHDLAIAIDNELAWRESQRRAADEIEETESSEEESAHRSEGSEVGTESFPFAAGPVSE